MLLSAAGVDNACPDIIRKQTFFSMAKKKC